MKLCKLMLGPIAAAAMLFGGTGAAPAVTYDYEFGTLLTPSGAIQPGVTFATLSVTTTNDIAFVFDLKTNNLNSIFGNGAFISSLFVNTLSGDGANSVAIIPAPTGYTLEQGVQNFAMNTMPSNLGGVDWEFWVDFCGTDNGNPCGQSDADHWRLQANEQVRWSTFFADVHDDPFFARPSFGLMVQGITIGSSGSATYTPTTPIPEPEIYAMLLAGLGLIGFDVRRRRQTHVAA